MRQKREEEKLKKLYEEEVSVMEGLKMPIDGT
jgi:hypothetical protein